MGFSDSTLKSQWRLIDEPLGSPKNGKGAILDKERKASEETKEKMGLDIGHRKAGKENLNAEVSSFFRIKFYETVLFESPQDYKNNFEAP